MHFLIDMCKFNKTVYEIEEGKQEYLYLTFTKPFSERVKIRLDTKNNTPYLTSKSYIIKITELFLFKEVLLYIINYLSFTSCLKQCQIDIQ